MSPSVALTFDFDADEVWIGDDPSNANRPVALSQGQYGARRGVDAVLGVLDRHGLRATFFVPGRVAERFPGPVGRIVDAGHELGCHGYTHRSPAEMDAAEQIEELERAVDALGQFVPSLSGYRSPSWELGAESLGLIAAAGFTYCSNFMDDHAPYRHEDTGLVELPVQWLLDDAPHFWFGPASWSKTIRSPEEVLSLWLPEIDGIVAVGGCAVLTMHPQLVGRPSRLSMLDTVLTHVGGLDGCRVGACDEIAAAFGRANGAVASPA